MKSSEELKYLMSAVDRGRIANLTYYENQIFCKKLLRRTKSLKQNRDDEFLAACYREKVNASSVAALTELKELRQAIYEGNNGRYRVIVSDALIRPCAPPKRSLDKMIEMLGGIAKVTATGKSRKSVALEKRIACLTARLIFEDLKSKPTHESGFSPNTFREQTAYPCKAGDINLYDDIMTALSVILDIEFSDHVLREARKYALQGRIA